MARCIKKQNRPFVDRYTEIKRGINGDEKTKQIIYLQTNCQPKTLAPFPPLQVAPYCGFR